MIIHDADSIVPHPHRPSPEAIREEWRKQDEALKDLRRRLRRVTGPRAVGFLATS